MSDNQDVTWDREILRNGAVCLFHDQTILEEAITWLQKHGYRIQDFKCTTWKSKEEFHTDISQGLQFPDYYGRNLDALNDCLSDLEVPKRGGIAIVFRQFDSFLNRYPEVAQNLLDIIEINSRNFLLKDRKLLCLVQSDNPKISFEPVGARPILWNVKEWFNENRRV